jgi:hypothetical protein
MGRRVTGYPEDNRVLRWQLSVRLLAQPQCADFIAIGA